MSDAITINGIQHSWGSIILKLNGERYYGITEISFGDKLEMSDAYGMGLHHSARGRSRGKYTTEDGKIKGFLSSMRIIREQLAAAGPDGITYGMTEFTLEVQSVENGPDESPIDVVLYRCRAAGTTTSLAEGNEATQEEMAFRCMTIERDGLTLFEDAV